MYKFGLWFNLMVYFLFMLGKSVNLVVIAVLQMWNSPILQMCNVLKVLVNP